MNNPQPNNAADVNKNGLNPYIDNKDVRESWYAELVALAVLTCLLTVAVGALFVYLGHI